MTKISEAKKKEVENLKNLLKQEICIGVIDLTNLPSAQFQKLRNKLKDQLNIRVSKKRLIKLAIENIKDSKKDIKKLEKYLENTIPALLFTKEDPFKLARTLNKNKSALPAKEGQIAPKDITIEAGQTKFSPGPIIGELGAAGIKAAIEEGKIVIKEPFTILKQGDTITRKQADLLAKFGIEPMEIGLNLLAIYKEGEILDKEVLFIDEKEYIEKIQTATRDAFNLAIYIAYPTKETIELLLQKAEREKISLESKIDLEKPVEEKKEKPKLEEKVEEPVKEETKKEQEAEKVEEKEIKEIPIVTHKEPEKPKVHLKKQETQQLKNPTEYSEEAAKKAQDIINKMKDNANGGK